MAREALTTLVAVHLSVRVELLHLGRPALRELAWARMTRGHRDMHSTAPTLQS